MFFSPSSDASALVSETSAPFVSAYPEEGGSVAPKNASMEETKTALPPFFIKGKIARKISKPESTFTLNISSSSCFLNDSNGSV